MNRENIFGVETEYGIMLKGRRGVSHDELSRDLIDAYAQKLNLATGYTSKRRILYSDIMLPNGARFYVDHGHPEYSTPECRSVFDLLACDKAGERILLQAIELVNKKLPSNLRILVFKNNTDHKGHSYGSHENFLITKQLFEELMQPSSERLHRHLIPFLVTRQIYAGAGKAGSENGMPQVDFQISQRADFFEKIIGIETTRRRPIINTRDEPHADPERFRRLHVIIGDANMCEVATLLKVGTTQFILWMLEDNVTLPNFKIEDPVEALHLISHDCDSTKNIKLENGKTVTPIDVQMEFLSIAEEYLKNKSMTEWEQKVLQGWEFVLQKLPNDKDQLIGMIDWITKHHLVLKYTQGSGMKWDSPLIKEIDIKYHNIDPKESLYYKLVEANVIKKLIPDERINYFVENPPQNTRAYLRGECIKKFSRNITEIDWAKIGIDSKIFHLSDPFAFNHDGIENLLKNENRL